MEIDGKFIVQKGSSFSKALYDELHLSTKQGNSIWLKIEKIIKDEEESLGDLWKVNAGQEFELKESTMKKILDLVNKKFKTSHTLGKRPAQNPDKKPGELGFNEDLQSPFTTVSNVSTEVAQKKDNKSQGPSSDVEEYLEKNRLLNANNLRIEAAEFLGKFDKLDLDTEAGISSLKKLFESITKDNIAYILDVRSDLLDIIASKDSDKNAILKDLAASLGINVKGLNVTAGFIAAIRKIVEENPVNNDVYGKVQAKAKVKGDDQAEELVEKLFNEFSSFSSEY